MELIELQTKVKSLEVELQHERSKTNKFLSEKNSYLEALEKIAILEHNHWREIKEWECRYNKLDLERIEYKEKFLHLSKLTNGCPSSTNCPLEVVDTFKVDEEENASVGEYTRNLIAQGIFDASPLPARKLSAAAAIQLHAHELSTLNAMAAIGIDDHRYHLEATPAGFATPCMPRLEPSPSETPKVIMPISLLHSSFNENHTNDTIVNHKHPLCSISSSARIFVDENEQTEKNDNVTTCPPKLPVEIHCNHSGSIPRQDDENLSSPSMAVEKVFTVQDRLDEPSSIKSDFLSVEGQLEKIGTFTSSVIFESEESLSKKNSFDPPKIFNLVKNNINVNEMVIPPHLSADVSIIANNSENSSRPVKSFIATNSILAPKASICVNGTINNNVSISSVFSQSIVTDSHCQIGTSLVKPLIPFESDNEINNASIFKESTFANLKSSNPKQQTISVDGFKQTNLVDGESSIFNDYVQHQTPAGKSHHTFPDINAPNNINNNCNNKIGVEPSFTLSASFLSNATPQPIGDSLFVGKPLGINRFGISSLGNPQNNSTWMTNNNTFALMNQSILTNNNYNDNNNSLIMNNYDNKTPEVFRKCAFPTPGGRGAELLDTISDSSFIVMNNKNNNSFSDSITAAVDVVDSVSPGGLHGLIEVTGDLPPTADSNNNNSTDQNLKKSNSTLTMHAIKQVELENKVLELEALQMKSRQLPSMPLPPAEVDRIRLSNKLSSPLNINSLDNNVNTCRLTNRRLSTTSSNCSMDINNPTSSTQNSFGAILKASTSDNIFKRNSEKIPAEVAKKDVDDGTPSERLATFGGLTSEPNTPSMSIIHKNEIENEENFKTLDLDIHGVKQIIACTPHVKSLVNFNEVLPAHTPVTKLKCDQLNEGLVAEDVVGVQKTFKRNLFNK